MCVKSVLILNLKNNILSLKYIAKETEIYLEGTFIATKSSKDMLIFKLYKIE